MDDQEHGWKMIARNLGNFILACALCFGIVMVMIYGHIEKLSQEARHWKDIEAEVRMKSLMGTFEQSDYVICIVNMNDWQWPLAELRINAKGWLTDVTYKLTVWDWAPEEERCFPPSGFKHWKHRWQFRGSRSDIETFTIIVKNKGWPSGKIIGVWVGERKSE